MVKIVQLFLISFLVILFVQTAWAGKIVGTAKARGVKNPTDVVVYVERVDGQSRPAKASVVIDQTKLTYIPHVTAVLAGTEIEFRNNDNDLHNIHARQGGKKLFNFGILPQQKVRKNFKQEGVVTLLCDVHPEMSAYVVVTQNPFFAKVGKDGSYSIENIPSGTYKLIAWHEGLPSQIKDIKISGVAGEVRVDFELRR